jgi:hypothetical protein
MGDKADANLAKPFQREKKQSTVTIILTIGKFTLN